MTTWHYPKAHAIGYRSILIDAGDRILGELDADLAAFAKTKLEGRGVEVRLKSRVAEVTGDRVFTDDGLDILTGTVISTIGNEQHPLVKQLGLPMERGRILVDDCLRVGVFARFGRWATQLRCRIPKLSAHRSVCRATRAGMCRQYPSLDTRR